MPLSRFAFIVKAAGYDPTVQKAVLDAPLFQTIVVGVSQTDEASAVASSLAESGTQLIELCGGFTAIEAALVQEKVGPNVPVGVVTYTPEQEARFATLFG